MCECLSVPSHLRAHTPSGLGHQSSTLLVPRPWALLQLVVRRAQLPAVMSWWVLVRQADPLLLQPCALLESQSQGVGLSLCTNMSPWRGFLWLPKVRHGPQRRSLGSSACLPKNLEYLGSGQGIYTIRGGARHRNFKISPGDSEGLIVMRISGCDISIPACSQPPPHRLV